MHNDILERISRRRRQLLIHSVIYYRLNDNIISDYTWSKWAEELVDLQIKYPDVAEKAALNDIYKDFDGSTGFDLAESADDWAINKAKQLLDYQKRRHD